MIDFSVPYIKNKKAELLEQAAGFPPFTRGYLTVIKPVQINEALKTQFTLQDYYNESIVELFSQIISRQAREKISLSIPFTGTIQEVVYIRVLRTLLAFITDKLYSNPTVTQFEFYGNYNNEKTSLNALIYANAAQIDTLMVGNTNDWKIIKPLLPQMPVDSLYGSNNLEKETSTLFFSLWKQIEGLLV